ncbi:single-stranded-DNA-specific exonuclease RecJ [Thiocapsa roseopersicina]|uniref:Single-stranded-DNA-specific exonuclease RecJ n=1 Tax=Thiocapsa roseopersicina TaxID=1058 RepID=A0A1H2S4N6_THIRO|nr:single-stranded-DNA-specific exonuclease RecJ [Thiocapsa roseopersicina]SDW26617.1 exonuclease RecJ [Thiocapsa roseopersicina]
MSRPVIRRATSAAVLAAARTPAELLSRLYSNRGLDGAEEPSPGLSALHPASALRGIDEAVDLLVHHIRGGGHLLIVSDYDADGATGGALAVRGLRSLGATQVSYLIPSRFAFGYGLSPAVVDAAAPRRPDLLITVDNGIASLTGVARAAELGIPVLVTDHHLPGERLPDAAAIVNPNQPGCAFPSKHLAGVGVVFYLLVAARARLREQGWFGAGRAEPNLADLLDLVALGTVADVVTLDRNNRILVEQGLRRIRAGRCSPGVRALLTIGGRDSSRATATDLAFVAAPRLNAAGRIEDMSVGVECLLTDDPQVAADLAARLDALNRRRREIEGEMKDAAESSLAGLCLDGAVLPPGLCLFGEDWHQGVSGIVAARIRERYHRPVIAFANGGDGFLRGSARSIEGVHVRDLIALVDRQDPGLIERFGGHAMAAGLSIRPEALSRFREAFAEAVRTVVGDRPPQPEIASDGALPQRLMNLETAETLRVAGPWGKGFPEPRFDGTFDVLSARLVGERHLKLRLAGPAAEDGPIEAIGFNLGEQISEAGGAVRLAYRLDVNDYRGNRSAQLILEHLEPAA